MLRKLALSVSMTVLVGIVLAWPFTYVGVNFLSAFAFFTVAQFIGFYFYNDYMQKRIALKEQELVLLQEAEFNKQGMEVTCPCDRRTKSFVPIVLNDKNDYLCPGCNKLVSVIVDVKTAVATVPVLESPEEIIKKNI